MPRIHIRFGNLNAAHPVNAILNYAYTILESEMRIKAIADGYDPTNARGPERIVEVRFRFDGA
jgi:hypothetical protein